MNTSTFLSKVLGIYLVLVSSAMLVNMHQFITLINGLMNDAPLLFVIGFFTLILGVIMVVSHNVWEWNWRVVITLIAWMTLLKGACLIFSPAWMHQATDVFLMQDLNVAYAAAGFDFALGMLLMYFGFKRAS
jgi:hypothetical protein